MWRRRGTLPSCHCCLYSMIATLSHELQHHHGALRVRVWVFKFTKSKFSLFGNEYPFETTVYIRYWDYMYHIVTTIGHYHYFANPRFYIYLIWNGFCFKCRLTCIIHPVWLMHRPFTDINDPLHACILWIEKEPEEFRMIINFILRYAYLVLGLTCFWLLYYGGRGRKLPGPHRTN